MRVLIASRNAEATAWLEGVLRSAGLSVVVVEEPGPASPELGASELVIADKDAAKALRGVGPDRRMLLVPRGEAVDLESTMGGGFMDLLVVPAPEDEVLGRVGRALDQFLRPQAAPQGTEGEVEELREIAERVTASLRKPGPRLERSPQELAEGMLSVFMLLIDSHESTEHATPGHSRRTGVLVRAIARELGRSAEETAWLELAGRLHDIGLVPLGLPLAGAAPLERELRREVEHHPDIAVRILEPLEDWGLPLEAIRNHHERTDGSGYPRGLEGDEVSVDAQILGAADVFEALTSARPWREAESPEGALEAMRSAGGFEEKVMEALEAVAGRDLGPPAPPPSPPGDR